MRSHDLILERAIAALKPEEYRLIRVGDWVDVLGPRGQTVEQCVRVDSAMPLAGRTRYQKARSEDAQDLEGYLTSGRLALCPLYGKRLQKAIMQHRAVG